VVICHYFTDKYSGFQEKKIAINIENMRNIRQTFADKKNDFFTVHDKIKSETVRISENIGIFIKMY